MGDSVQRRWRKKCRALSKRTGNRCGQWAIPGLDVCKWHGGATEKARAKGARVMQLQVAGAAVERFGGRRNVGPQTAMIEMIEQAAWAVEFWRGKINAELAPSVGPGMIEIPDPFGDPADMPGESATQRVWAEGLFGPNHLGDSVPHPYLAAYHAASDRLMRYSRAAIAAGVELAMVEARVNGERALFAAVRDVLAAHGLDVTVPEVGKAIADRLRAASVPLTIHIGTMIDGEEHHG